MRYLKRVVRATLIYTACYLVLIAVLQALTGYDFTAAYSVGGITGVGEAVLCSIIKIFELKEFKKLGFNSNNKCGPDDHHCADNGVSDPMAEDKDQRGSSRTAE